MKMKYTLLYKSGHKEEIITRDSERGQFEGIQQSVKRSFRESGGGYIQLINEDLNAVVINIGQLARVKVEELRDERSNTLAETGETTRTDSATEAG